MSDRPKMTMDSFGEIMKCAASIKTAQLAEKRRVFDKQPSFIQSGLYLYGSLKMIINGSFEKRLEYAEKLHKEGKEEFSKGEIEFAQSKFEEMLCLFRFIIPLSENWKQEPIEDTKMKYVDFTGDTPDEIKKVSEFKLLAYLSIAACSLKTNNPKNAILACDEALKLEPNSIKALYFFKDLFYLK